MEKRFILDEIEIDIIRKYLDSIDEGTLNKIRAKHKDAHYSMGEIGSMMGMIDSLKKEISFAIKD